MPPLSAAGLSPLKIKPTKPFAPRCTHRIHYALLASTRPPRICRHQETPAPGPPHTAHIITTTVISSSSTKTPPPQRQQQQRHQHQWRWQQPCARHPAAPHRAPCAAVVCSAREARLAVPCGGGDERRCGLCRVCAAAAEEQPVRQRRGPVHAQLGGGGRVGRQHKQRHN